MSEFVSQAHSIMVDRSQHRTTGSPEGLHLTVQASCSLHVGADPNFSQRASGRLKQVHVPDRSRSIRRWMSVHLVAGSRTSNQCQSKESDVAVPA